MRKNLHFGIVLDTKSVVFEQICDQKMLRSAFYLMENSLWQLLINWHARFRRGLVFALSQESCFLSMFLQPAKKN